MNCMGSIGRLGNQMFQYAALKSIAKKFNYEYCLPRVESKCQDSYGNPEDLNLFDCFYLNNEEKKNTNFDYKNIRIIFYFMLLCFLATKCK